MALTLSNEARSAAADAVTALLNGGDLRLLTSGDAVLVTLDFSATAFGAASNGVATANTISTENAADTGVAAKFQARTSGGAVRLTGTVGSGSGDIDLVTTSITSGQPVTVTSLTYTQPAS
jgi:hypothetical protein